MADSEARNLRSQKRKRSESSDSETSNETVGNENSSDPDSGTENLQDSLIEPEVCQLQPAPLLRETVKTFNELVAQCENILNPPLNSAEKLRYPGAMKPRLFWDRFDPDKKDLIQPRLVPGRKLTPHTITFDQLNQGGPTLQDVNAMFNYGTERSYIVENRAVTARQVVQAVMDKIGSDPEKLRGVIACTGSSILPPPKSVTVTILNRRKKDADGNFINSSPLYVATCFNRIEFLPKYPVDTWISYLEALFLNPMYAEYNREHDLARYSFDDCKEEGDDEIWIGGDPIPEDEDSDEELFFDP